MIELLRLFGFLERISRHLQFSRATIVLAVVTGIASGLGYMGLIVLINRAVTDGPSRAVFYGFIALCAAAPLSRLAAQVLLNSIGARAVFGMRLLLCRKILATPLQRLEEIGPSRLLASLADDVATITSALVQIPTVAVQLATVVACLAYMGRLSWQLLLATLALMAVGVASYSVPLGMARRYAMRQREAMDQLFRSFRGLVEGAKELKLNRRRREIFLASDLIPANETIRRATALGNTLFTSVPVWGNFLYFLVFGVLAFVVARRPGVDLQVVTGYTMALLFTMSPMDVLLQTLPTLSRAAVAARKFERLGIELTAPDEETDTSEPAGRPLQHRLELAGVTHTYGVEGLGGFTLGPISLVLNPGEIVFFIGGNGSGKTTLAKVLTGLYLPEQGEIRLDGEVVTDWEAYRQSFSAVFSDFYLFPDLPPVGADAEGRAAGYLTQLQLDEKVRVSNGRVSTLDLSQGQRKRLALLAAYLEDRPIYFFDEWAADQDPNYKAVFYREILPELKARGKTVFVISHDDQYFGAANRIVKLDSGCIEWDRRHSEIERAWPCPASAARAS